MVNVGPAAQGSRCGSGRVVLVHAACDPQGADV